MCTRLFFIGVITLLLGLQFRFVETFVFNERASRVLSERKQLASLFDDAPRVETSYSDFDYDWDLKPVANVTRRRLTPPRWIGWSLLSAGAVLILTCPCFRRS